MIRIAGTLNIKAIKGRNGLFAIGELTTAIGNFKVKDAALDQYEPGTYTGEFCIQRIYPSSYIHGGRAVIEVRAELDSSLPLRLDDYMPKDSLGIEGVVEPDPIDEVIKPALESVTVTQTCELPAEESEAPILGAELAKAVAAKEPVKLDPTIDRAVFRQQRDLLKSLGYRFDAGSQTWVTGE